MKRILLAAALCVASLSVSAAPKSIFLQLNQTFDEAKTRIWLQKACDNNAGTDPNVKLTNLVIQEATYSDGSLREPQLTVAADYFNCFNAIFLGVSHKTEAQWKDWPAAPDSNPANDNAGTMYDAGIKNTSFRQANIALAKLGADNLAARFPSLAFYWYISYESNLNYQTDAAIRTAYKDYLSQVSNYLYSVKARSILWSPSFWTPYASLSAVQREDLTVALADVFASSPRINRLDFQDFIGQASTVTCVNGTNCLPWQAVNYPIDYRNTVSYYALLQDARSRSGSTITNLMVNMEMFITQRKANGDLIGLIPGDPVELTFREGKYVANSIPIGASFEIRYWYLSNYGVPEVEWKYP